MPARASSSRPKASSQLTRGAPPPVPAGSALRYATRRQITSQLEHSAPGDRGRAGAEGGQRGPRRDQNQHGRDYGQAGERRAKKRKGWRGRPRAPSRLPPRRPPPATAHRARPLRPFRPTSPACLPASSIYGARMRSSRGRPLFLASPSLLPC